MRNGGGSALSVLIGMATAVLALVCVVLLYMTLCHRPKQDRSKQATQFDRRKRPNRKRGPKHSRLVEEGVTDMGQVPECEMVQSGQQGYDSEDIVGDSEDGGEADEASDELEADTESGQRTAAKNPVTEEPNFHV